MTEDNHKYIYTKRRVYRLPTDAKGIAVEETHPGAQVPTFLKGAVVYDTPRGRIIAHREPERGGDEMNSDASQGGPHALGKDASDARPATVERLGASVKLKEPPAGPQDHPMRFFRRDAPAQVVTADPWQAVKIDCQEAFTMRSQRTGIEDPATAAREVRALLMRHFPEGPAMAAQSRQEARRWNTAADRALSNGTEAPDRTDPASRWSAFCRDYTSALKQAQSEGLAPAACNPYADIHFSGSGRERPVGSRGRNRERDGFER
jgi:hypothetical protein